MSYWYTLLAVAAPQSQNVHENGQPRLVSQSAIHFWFGCARISGSNTPDRYGDGTTVEIGQPRPFGVADEEPGVVPVGDARRRPPRAALTPFHQRQHGRLALAADGDVDERVRGEERSRRRPESAVRRKRSTCRACSP